MERFAKAAHGVRRVAVWHGKHRGHEAGFSAHAAQKSRNHLGGLPPGAVVPSITAGVRARLRPLDVTQKQENLLLAIHALQKVFLQAEPARTRAHLTRR